MKKSLHIVTLISLIISSITSFAQLEDFKLSEYKLPDLKRQQLDLITNFGGFYENDNRISGDRSSKIFNGSGMMDIYYNFYRNSAKYQGSQSALLGGSYRVSNYEYIYTNSSYQNNERKYSRWVGEIDLQSDNRLYFDDLNFFEIDLNAKYSNQHYNTNNNSTQISNITDQTTATEKSNLYEFELPLYYGYGRIERVEDVRQAVFILHDLQKLKRLKRVPNDDEIIAFAQQISEVKNKRFYDSRIQKIEELKIADAYLSDADLIEESDITYFTSLNDMWSYGDRQIRLAGYRVYGGIVPMMGINTMHEKYDSELNDTNYIYPDIHTENKYKNRIQQLFFRIGFEYQKPIKQKWQYFLLSNIQLGPSKTTNNYENVLISSNNPESSLKLMDYSGYIETGFGFYPNTRTYLDVRVDGLINYNKGTYTDNITEEDAKNTFKSFNASFGAYYYISPKIRLSGRYSYGYVNLDGKNSILGKYDILNYFRYSQIYWNIYQDENVFKTNFHNFELTFTYSIF